MTIGCQVDIAAHVGGADRGQASAGAILRTRRPQPETSWEESLSLPPEPGGLAGALLACTAPLAFCSGLIGLAMSSLLEAPAPRWLILAYGGGCVLLALLAALLSRPRRIPSPARPLRCCGTSVDVDGDGLATWNGSPASARPVLSTSDFPEEQP
jgi:hypothetical protein